MAQENKSIEVVILPYHGQGHMNTMVQFAKRLSYKGVHVTIATTNTTIQQMLPNISSSLNSITLEPIYDDTDEPNIHFKDGMVRFEAEATSNLTRVILARKQQAPNKRCLLVYHWSLQWALSVARQNNVKGAVFFTICASTFVSYYRLHLESDGIIKEEFEVPSVLPDKDLICGHDHVKTDNGLHPMILWLLKDFGQSVKADFVLINSFDKLEEEAINWTSKTFNIKTIGPTLPSTYLDNRILTDSNYGFNQHNPSKSEHCINWLNTKPSGAVLYIAFGSQARLSTEQTSEIAESLLQSSIPFLWAMRDTEQVNLPTSFLNQSSESGLVVPWAPQLDVLAHNAVGCFMSHCGWNSTIEAVSLGVPVLAMPQFLDQFVDAYFVDQVWGVGIRAVANESGLVVKDEIKRCVGEIMGDGPRGRGIKENVVRWKGLAKAAVDDGGCSDRHIDEIISEVASS